MHTHKFLSTCKCSPFYVKFDLRVYINSCGKIYNAGGLFPFKKRKDNTGICMLQYFVHVCSPYGCSNDPILNAAPESWIT